MRKRLIELRICFELYKAIWKFDREYKRDKRKGVINYEY